MRTVRVLIGWHKYQRQDQHSLPCQMGMGSKCNIQYHTTKFDIILVGRNSRNSFKENKLILYSTPNLRRERVIVYSDESLHGTLIHFRISEHCISKPVSKIKIFLCSATSRQQLGSPTMNYSCAGLSQNSAEDGHGQTSYCSSHEISKETVRLTKTW